MAIYLRQICLVADRLQPAIDELSAVFSMPACHVDPAVGKFGLENTLLLVGNQFIEVVAPLPNSSPLESTAAGRFLKRRNGNGGYMVICQVPDLQEQAALRERANKNNVRVAYESDRGTWNILQLHPADMGAAFFEVDWDQQADMQGNWQPAGGSAWKNLTSTEVVSAIAAVELQSDDPESLAAHWSKITGVPLTHRNNNSTLALANAELRFVEAVDGRGPGLGGLDLRVVNRERLLSQARTCGVEVVDDRMLICGTRFMLV